MFASLGLYDWPETASSADLLWSAVAEYLRENGIAAPAHLNRVVPFSEAPRQSDLLIAQTCGLPLVRHHNKSVKVVGSFVHNLPVPAGTYRSAIVVRQKDSAQTVDDLQDRSLAANEPDSWSGIGVWRRLIVDRKLATPFFSKIHWTGGHRDSIAAVAAGEADVAAIDGVYWAIAEKGLANAAHLRVLAFTDPVPSLPLVTSPNGPRNMLIKAFEHAVETLSAESRDHLCLSGFRPRTNTDYDPLGAFDEAATKAGLTEFNR